MDTCSSLRLFRELKVTYDMSYYLKTVNCKKYRDVLAKFRLSVHMMQIETGRHNNVHRADRKCYLCDTRDLEDEYHFITVCPVYNEIRQSFIPGLIL